MSEYLLEQAPIKTITARRLWELAKENAVLTPLYHQLGDAKPTASTPKPAPTS